MPLFVSVPFSLSSQGWRLEIEVDQFMNWVNLIDATQNLFVTVSQKIILEVRDRRIRIVIICGAEHDVALQAAGEIIAGIAGAIEKARVLHL